MDIASIKRACELMHKTGADDSQYVLVRLSDLEEMVEAWERDKILQKWMNRIFTALQEVKNEDNESGKAESNHKNAEESGTGRDSKGSEDRKMDHGGVGEEGSPEERS